ncbi:hypothetical protein [Saccharopolyspora phatthalungensis]|uniref:Uncharacterized protein n=1 Tax=Saccharopolyspora phatthalungensis TaxID=664693 RepID=A0A840PRF0_9PSEU|nr:hypothetical protein [Saccharopolyspora phatthalungensis]MBB5152882.1 hypothetical protein [Saccharopolyspora phatthalungensis]
MTASYPAVTLTDHERDICGARADVLIPNAAGMPAATQMDVHSIWIEHALGARPDLADRFRASLAEAVDEPPAEAIETLHKNSPELFDAFSVLVAGAYLMSPEVRALIGYPGQENRPVANDEVKTYIHLLERVVQRGPIYRPTV